MKTIGYLEKFSFQKAHLYAALLYAVSISLHQKLATIALLLWAFISLVNFSVGALNKKGLLLALPFLYLTYLLATFYTGAASLSFLEHKLSFLVFPLIFFLHNYTAEERLTILKSFIYGLLLAITYCLLMAFYRSLVIDETGLNFVPNVLEGKAFFEAIIYGGNHFFGNHFSLFHQTVYFGLYLCSAITILLFDQRIFGFKQRAFTIAAFTIVLFLLSNKAAFLALALIFVIKIFTLKIALSKKAIILFSLLITAVLFAILNPRIKGSLQKLGNMQIGIDKDARFDFSIRILSWDAAIDLIKEKPLLGYGAGNTQQEFNSIYAKKDYTFPLKEKLNAHNQFFQSWIENGLLGLLGLIGIFVVLLKVSLKSDFGRSTFVVLILIILINALFESVFNRFSGISFISFIACFILSETSKKGGVHET